MNPAGSGGLPNFLYCPARQRVHRRSLRALKVQRVMGAGIKVREAATHPLREQEKKQEDRGHMVVPWRDRRHRMVTTSRPYAQRRQCE